MGVPAEAFEPKPRPPAEPIKARRATAVALKHDRGELPRIIASGHGATAARILDIAFAAGIQVREDGDLAEMLAAVELNAPIPTEAFAAVAEILNYLYRLNAGMRP